MKTLLDQITAEFLTDADSPATQQAKKIGLVSKGWGRWADPRTDKVTHKTQDDKLVPVDSTEEPSKSDRTSDTAVDKLAQVAKDLKKIKSTSKQSKRKVSIRQTTTDLSQRGTDSILDTLNEPEFSTKEIKQFEEETGVDVARALSDPMSYLLVTDEDYSWAGSEEEQKEQIIKQLKEQMNYWTREDSRGGDQRDRAYDIGKFQLAFPTGNKEMSDEQAREALQRDLDTPSTVSGELNKIVREGTKTISKEVRLATRESHSEWADKQDESYDAEVGGWQRNINREALQRIDKRIKSDPPPPIQTDLPVHRGMAMNDKDLEEFLGQLEEGSEIELPIGSFSFDPSVAGEFADAQVSHDYRPNVTIGEDATHAVVLQVTGRDSSLNGLYMNGNHSRPKLKADAGLYGEQQEVLLPSGGYTVESVETKDHDGRQFVVVNLTQEN